KRTTFFPANSSFVDREAGPFSVMCINLASGNVSPAWIAILFLLARTKSSFYQRPSRALRLVEERAQIVLARPEAHDAGAHRHASREDGRGEEEAAAAHEPVHDAAVQGVERRVVERAPLRPVPEVGDREDGLREQLEVVPPAHLFRQEAG